MAGVVYLSCVNVNSIIWMVRRGVGIRGLVVRMVLLGLTMFGLSLARHMQLVVRHEHGSLHGGMSCGWLSILPEFLNV